MTITEVGNSVQRARGYQVHNQTRAMFPKYLCDKLDFLEKEAFILVKPRHILGCEDFVRVIDFVWRSGGEYVSAGKESHFRIPRA